MFEKCLENSTNDDMINLEHNACYAVMRPEFLLRHAQYALYSIDNRGIKPLCWPLLIGETA